VHQVGDQQRLSVLSHTKSKHITGNVFTSMVA